LLMLRKPFSTNLLVEMSSRSSRTPKRQCRGGVRRSQCRAAATGRRVLAAHGEVDVEPVQPGDEYSQRMTYLMQLEVGVVVPAYSCCVLRTRT
jgi:hypothetical protein